MILYPKILQIEITDACNLHCSYCDIHENHKHPGTMPFERVAWLIRQAQYASHVCPQYWGEPTLHPDFLQILRLCVESGKTASFYTNGLLLDTFDIPEVLRNTSEIRISMDNTTPDGFLNTTGSGSFERVRRNIVACWEAKKRFSLGTRIIIRATELVPAQPFGYFVSFWGPYCDSVELKPLRLSAPPPGIELMDRKTCDFPTRHIVIKRDGTVVLCCSDHNKQCPIGNVFESTVLDIFNSPRYNELRQQVGELPLCHNCWYRYRRRHTPSGEA